jgi:hypothetical protein
LLIKWTLEGKSYFGSNVLIIFLNPVDCTILYGRIACAINFPLAVVTDVAVINVAQETWLLISYKKHLSDVIDQLGMQRWRTGLPCLHV